MIIHDVAQNSPQWFALHIGIPTASRFSDIVQESTGKPTRSKDGKGMSKASRSYAFQLAVERLTQRAQEDVSKSAYMQRGKDLEDTAARFYSVTNQVELKKVGFVTTDDKRFGASPDRLVVRERGGVEIKCPSDHVHLAYLIDGFDAAYNAQAQGQIHVAELDYVDRFSFHPDWPSRRDRTDRDDVFIRNLRDALEEFDDLVCDIVEKAKALGIVQAAAHLITPAEAAYGDDMDEQFDRIRRGEGNGNLLSIPSLESIDQRSPFGGG